MRTTLAGRCGIVTDATSVVGRAIALELAREGARLAVGYRAYRGVDFEAVEQLVHDLVRVGGESVPMRVPLQSIADLEEAIGHLVTFWSRLDFVVDLSADCAVGRAALPWLFERGRGRIVHISVPPAGTPLFTSADLRALAGRGIAFNSIVLDSLPSLEAVGVRGEHQVEVSTALISRAPGIPRATPEDVAAAAEFLLAQACCVTGQQLDFGGERRSGAPGSRHRIAFSLRRSACSQPRHLASKYHIS
jgi:NAD(P)-dependent dehydrogenase (short-subunit alcohol dehydrogenase family)